MHRAVRAALAAGWYDEQDLMRTAADIVGAAGSATAELGPVVCHLPQRWSVPAAHLLATLAERDQRELVIVAGLTGDVAADASVRAAVELVGGKFDDTNGAYPGAGLVQATNGDFYGTTVGGGAYNYGTVFKMTPSGTLTVLHSFDGTDGSQPSAVLIQARNGDLYGTTYQGGVVNSYCGAGCGT